MRVPTVVNQSKTDKAQEIRTASREVRKPRLAGGLAEGIVPSTPAAGRSNSRCSLRNMTRFSGRCVLPESIALCKVHILAHYPQLIFFHLIFL